MDVFGGEDFPTQKGCKNRAVAAVEGVNVGGAVRQRLRSFYIVREVSGSSLADLRPALPSGKKLYPAGWGVKEFRERLKPEHASPSPGGPSFLTRAFVFASQMGFTKADLHTTFLCCCSSHGLRGSRHPTRSSRGSLERNQKFALSTAMNIRQGYHRYE